MINKYYSRKQLYVAANVSRTTFYRWLLNDQDVLSQMGVTPYQQLLPPDVVEYICKKHRICSDNLS
jgi:hypothetical protein